MDVEERSTYKIERQFWDIIHEPDSEEDAKVLIDRYRNDDPAAILRIVKYTNTRTILHY